MEAKEGDGKGEGMRGREVEKGRRQRKEYKRCVGKGRGTATGTWYIHVDKSKEAWKRSSFVIITLHKEQGEKRGDVHYHGMERVSVLRCSVCECAC